MRRPLEALAALQGMDAATWERHANPWSAWTRVPILPLLALAIWSRAWIGAWCLAPVAALALWTWINPRAFPPPRTTRSWSTRAVMGERIWLDRARRPVPAHHARLVPLLVALAGLGMPFIAWGLWRLDLWMLLFGLSLSLLSKFWFLDRMVWLFDDMSAKDPIYRAWLR